MRLGFVVLCLVRERERERVFTFLLNPFQALAIGFGAPFVEDICKAGNKEMTPPSYIASSFLTAKWLEVSSARHSLSAIVYSLTTARRRIKFLFPLL